MNNIQTFISLMNCFNFFDMASFDLNGEVHDLIVDKSNESLIKNINKYNLELQTVNVLINNLYYDNSVTLDMINNKKYELVNEFLDEYHYKYMEMDNGIPQFVGICKYPEGLHELRTEFIKNGILMPNLLEKLYNLTVNLNTFFSYCRSCNMDAVKYVSILDCMKTLCPLLKEIKMSNYAIYSKFLYDATLEHCLTAGDFDNINSPSYINHTSLMSYCESSQMYQLVTFTSKASNDSLMSSFSFKNEFGLSNNLHEQHLYKQGVSVPKHSMDNYMVEVNKKIINYDTTYLGANKIEPITKNFMTSNNLVIRTSYPELFVEKTMINNHCFNIQKYKTVFNFFIHKI